MGFVKCFHHISLKCSGESEFKKALDFYQNILGLQLIRIWPRGCMLQAGTAFIEIFKYGRDTNDPGVIQHFALQVWDLSETIHCLKSKMVFCEEPKIVTFESNPSYRIAMAFLVGPLNERIELLQELD